MSSCGTGCLNFNVSELETGRNSLAGGTKRYVGLCEVRRFGMTNAMSSKRKTVTTTDRDMESVQSWHSGTGPPQFEQLQTTVVARFCVDVSSFCVACSVVGKLISFTPLHMCLQKH